MISWESPVSGVTIQRPNSTVFAPQGFSLWGWSGRNMQLNTHICLFLILRKLLGDVLPYLDDTECLSAGTPDLKPTVLGFVVSRAEWVLLCSRGSKFSKPQITELFLQYSRHDERWCHLMVEMRTTLKHQNVKNILRLILCLLDRTSSW